MKIFFTYSWGDSESVVQTNYKIAKNIFPDIELIYGKKTISETYRNLSFLADEEFIWIDSDNIVYPESKKILEFTGPCILMTKNEYNIVYGHGGIKKCNPYSFVRNNAIDVTYYLGLEPVDIIGSFHTLGTGWTKDRAVFVEMIKCALKDNLSILEQWKNARPDIWAYTEKLLITSDIDSVIDLIRNREKFKKFYEDSMRINL